MPLGEMHRRLNPSRRNTLTPLIGIDRLNGMSKNDSFRARILALEPGATASDSRRFSLGFTSAEEMSKAVEDMRNKANPAVKIAKETGGGEYTVESGDFRTKSFDIITTVAVTRIK